MHSRGPRVEWESPVHSCYIIDIRMSHTVNLADTVRAGMAGALDPRLLEAGRRVFATHGYGGATVERIAREAGLSRGTLHRRGVSKETILAALAERGIEHYRAALWPALTAPGNGAERLRAALEGLCAA